MGINRSTLQVLLIACVFTTGCYRSPQPTGQERESQSTGTVTFRIDDGEETLVFEIEDVREGETLEAVMKRIDQVPISMHGSGVTAFVDAIGGRSTRSAEGWTFTIDGQFSERGVGQTKLNPPTTITWTFGSSSLLE